jgi:multiple sugar transport system permease protein
LPSITPIVATGLIFVFFFSPTTGLANYLLSFVGIKEGPGWLASTIWSKPALIIIALWGSVGGGNMLIFLAGLQGIPVELTEAADIDGANAWQKWWRVSLPLLTPTIFFALLLGMIGALAQFTLAYVVTAGGAQTRVVGGPAYSTLFYVLNLYNYAFSYWEMGFGSALAWVFFLAVLILTFIQLRSSRAWVYYEAAGAGEMRW